ncbi:phage major capsid family protein [Mycobacterium sp. Dal123C01]|uniref:phage major capsid family protein n=1 Tax=Mycobacterium sp. Dal123C01 TaxID=3457577 RepID=UPI00403EB38C
MSSANQEMLARLRATARDVEAQRKQIFDRAQAESRDTLSVAETAEFRSLTELIEGLVERAKDLREEVEREGSLTDAQRHAVLGGAGGDSRAASLAWGRTAAQALRRDLGGKESRAVISGSVDIPNLVQPSVVAIPRPVRLIDLFTNRQGVDCMAFEYFRATVRTNNAAAVPDLAEKPTSVNTVVPVNDRCRVIAHLSEPVPYRIWVDENEIANWLSTELAQGVLDALEAEAVGSAAGTGPGTGSGEHMTGLLKVAGTTAVAYNTDLPTTLRSAVTALQNIGVVPNGWALNPADAQTIDLLRWGSSGGFLSGGYPTGLGAQASLADNIFGETRPRVVSPSIPQGTAILADWNAALKLFVHWNMQIIANAFGDTLFATNAVQVRAEALVGIGILQPRAAAIVDLTA